jgi:proline iminopeptidase
MRLRIRQLAWAWWEALALQAPQAARGNLLAWLHAGLHGDQPQAALSRAIAWQAWESSVSQHRSAAPRPEPIPAEDAAALLDKYRLQSHYLTNGCFWGDAPLLTRAPALAGVPTAILHGRQDWICRPEAAWALHRSLPNSRLQWLDGCGHSPFEPAMARALLQAASHFASHGNFTSWAESFSDAGAP